MADGPGDPFATTRSATSRMFGDLAKALARSGPAELGRGAAVRPARRRGRRRLEANIDPSVRIKLGRLGRRSPSCTSATSPGSTAQFPEIIAGHARRVGAADARGLPAAVHRAGHVARQRPTLPTADEPDDRRVRRRGDPMMAMMASLSAMMAPSMMGMAVGSMVGRMATRAFGQYDLPIPRRTTRSLIVPANIDRFADGVGMPADEMRLWVLAHELIGHALFSITSLREDFAVAGSPPRRRVPPRSVGHRREADHPRHATAATRCRRCSRRSSTRRCCSARCSRPSRLRWRRRSTPRRRRSSATSTTWSTACRVPGHRRRRAAHRRGGPAPPGRDSRPTTCTSSGCSV